MVVIYPIKGNISFIKPHSHVSIRTKSFIRDSLLPSEPLPLRDGKFIKVVLSIPNSTVVCVIYDPLQHLWCCQLFTLPQSHYGSSTGCSLFLYQIYLFFQCCLFLTFVFWSISLHPRCLIKSLQRIVFWSNIISNH